jgi:hypothetical protein
MALRFQKRIKIAPGIRLNLSKSGVSVSAGPKGASLNVGKNGKHLTLGIPGTGLSSRTRIGNKPDPSPKASIGSTILGLLILVGLGWAIWAALT